MSKAIKDEQRRIRYLRRRTEISYTVMGVGREEAEEGERVRVEEGGEVAIYSVCWNVVVYLVKGSDSNSEKETGKMCVKGRYTFVCEQVADLDTGWA